LNALTAGLFVLDYAVADTTFVQRELFKKTKKKKKGKHIKFVCSKVILALFFFKYQTLSANNMTMFLLHS